MMNVGYNLLIDAPPLWNIAHPQATPRNIKNGSGLGMRLRHNAYQNSCHKGSPVGRGEKAKTSKDESNEGHEEDLRSTSHAHR